MILLYNSSVVFLYFCYALRTTDRADSAAVNTNQAYWLGTELLIQHTSFEWVQPQHTKPNIFEQSPRPTLTPTSSNFPVLLLMQADSPAAEHSGYKY